MLSFRQIAIFQCLAIANIVQLIHSLSKQTLLWYSTKRSFIFTALKAGCNLFWVKYTIFHANLRRLWLIRPRRIWKRKQREVRTVSNTCNCLAVMGKHLHNSFLPNTNKGIFANLINWTKPMVLEYRTRWNS